MEANLCYFCKHAYDYGSELKCDICKEENQEYNYVFNHPWVKFDVTKCKDYDLNEVMKEDLQKEEHKKNEYNQKKEICPMLGDFCNTDGNCDKCINEEEEFQQKICKLECKEIRKD